MWIKTEKKEYISVMDLNYKIVEVGKEGEASWRVFAFGRNREAYYLTGNYSKKVAQDILDVLMKGIRKRGGPDLIDITEICTKIKEAE